MLPLDQRTLPDQIPDALAQEILLARELRSGPVKCLVEGALGFDVAGLQAFDDFVIREQIRADHGSEALENYLAGIQDAPSILDLAVNGGWRVSPLATGLRFGSGFISGEPFLPARHVRLISDTLVRAARGTGPRKIAISLAFRHGKSACVSGCVPLWYLASNPHHSIGLLTYSDEFSETLGRLVRNAITPEFGFSVSEDSRAAGRFNTTLGGSVWSVGVHGGAQGRGGNLVVIDDPFKLAEEAFSKTYRESVWQWFMSTAMSRLQDAGIVVIVGTRWHSEDLHGSIKSGRDGVDPGDWMFIDLPAICDTDGPDLIGRRRGDPLWPEKRGLEELESKRRSTSHAVWESAYMCKPLDETGAGRAYGSFIREQHVRACVFDDRLPIRVGIDFNVCPMSLVILQLEEHWSPMAHLTNERLRRFVALDEISLDDSSTAEASQVLGARLVSLVRGAKGVHVHIYADASGNARSTKSENGKTDWDILRRELGKVNGFRWHFHPTSSNVSVKARVDEVNGLLEQGCLQIDPRCSELIEDLRAVRWKLTRDGRREILDKTSDSDRTHASDAMGYAVATSKAKFSGAALMR